MANKWEDLQITKEELNNIETALKDKEFRKLLVDYCEEINDPANKKIYQKEITQLEKERGNDVIFIEPKEGYVIKTSLDGSKLAFINICSNENVQRPTSETTEQNGSFGSNWSIPHLISPPREDLNKKSKRCTVYDVIFHPEALIFSSRNKKFRELLNNIACDAIESNYSVNLDKTNLKFPKMKFKGMSRPLVIRKKVEESPKLDSDDPIDKIYSDIYDQMDTKIPKPKTLQNPKGPQTTQKSKYTTPKYIIKHRTSVDLQDFTLGGTAHQNDAIPKELVIEIDLPLLKTSSDLNLDVSEKSLSLSSEKPAKYQLFLTLPYAVCEEKGSAKFDQDSRKLTITLPVLRRNLSLDNDSGVESDHVLSNCNSIEENSPLVSEIKEKFDYNLSNLDNGLKFDEDCVKNCAKNQNGGPLNQKVGPLSQNGGPIIQKGSSLTQENKPSENLVSCSGAKGDKSETGSCGSHISKENALLSQKEQNVVKKENGEHVIQNGTCQQNGDHENQNGEHLSPNEGSAKQNGEHPIQNCNPLIQKGDNLNQNGENSENKGNHQKGEYINQDQKEAPSQNSVCKSENRTSMNMFLDPELHYSFPEFTCHTFNDILVFTLRVKNVQNSSFEKVFPNENSVHIKFYSMSPSFVPINYSVLLNFPECSKIAKDEFISEIWDNNLIFQVSFLNEAPSNYFIGSSENDSEEKFVEEPSNIYNKINTKLDSSSDEIDEKPNCKVMCTETNGVEIVLTKSDCEVSESEHSSPPIDKTNPKKLSHSYSESSCDEFSVSPTKGILKSRSRTPLSRSVSESSADDYTWSSFENFASVSDSLIPEEYEEHVSSSMKKTVRFNDVVSKQLFRTNSSILGQKKKNQRKSRNKKRAQERRLSESENSEAEEKVNKYLKKPSETDKVQIENENLTDKTDQKSSNDLIFDIDM